eukprot:1217678-Rhodomonas_salina.1
MSGRNPVRVPGEVAEACRINGLWRANECRDRWMGQGGLRKSARRGLGGWDVVCGEEGEVLARCEDVAFGTDRWRGGAEHARREDEDKLSGCGSRYFPVLLYLTIIPENESEFARPDSRLLAWERYPGCNLSLANTATQHK